MHLCKPTRQLVGAGRQSASSSPSMWWNRADVGLPRNCTVSVRSLASHHKETFDFYSATVTARLSHHHHYHSPLKLLAKLCWTEKLGDKRANWPGLGVGLGALFAFLARDSRLGCEKEACSNDSCNAGRLLVQYAICCLCSDGLMFMEILTKLRKSTFAPSSVRHVECLRLL